MDKLAPVGQGAGTFQGVATQSAATLTPVSERRRPAPLTQEQRDEAVHMYVDERQPIRVIAQRFDRSYGTMHRVLTEAGVEMRGRNGR